LNLRPQHYECCALTSWATLPLQYCAPLSARNGAYYAYSMYRGQQLFFAISLSLSCSAITSPNWATDALN